MKKSLLILSIALFIICNGFFIYSGEKIKFKEIERVHLQFDDLVFYSIPCIKKIPNGYVLLLHESAYGSNFSIVRLSTDGKILSVYNQRGSGPGQLGRVNSLVDTGKSILVSEATYPFVHEFTYDLKFIRDYRVKRGGDIMLVGDYAIIWATYTPGQKKTDKKYMAALYNRKNFEFKKYSFEISEIPALVQGWGNICQIDENTYAGIYGTEYQIRIYDKWMNFKKNLIKKIPDYIIKYTPLKNDQNAINKESIKWMESWSKMHALFYADGKLILRYALEKDMYLDVFDKNGKPLIVNYKEINGNFIKFTEGNYFWLLEIMGEEDDSKYCLVKTKLLIE